MELFIKFFLIVCLICPIICYDILGIFPVGAKSHYAVGYGLMKGLALKGHSVTMISPYLEPEKITNFTTIQTINVFNSIEGISGMI